MEFYGWPLEWILAAWVAAGAWPAVRVVREMDGSAESDFGTCVELGAVFLFLLLLGPVMLIAATVGRLATLGQWGDDDENDEDPADE